MEYALCLPRVVGRASQDRVLYLIRLSPLGNLTESVKKILSFGLKDTVISSKRYSVSGVKDTVFWTKRYSDLNRKIVSFTPKNTPF